MPDITASLPAPQGDAQFPRLSLNTDPSLVQHTVAREGAPEVVFDWKSDVAPSPADQALYAGQLAQYLRVLGGERGAIVYMTSGLIHWVTAGHA